MYYFVLENKLTKILLYEHYNERCIHKYKRKERRNVCIGVRCILRTSKLDVSCVVHTRICIYHCYLCWTETKEYS